MHLTSKIHILTKELWGCVCGFVAPCSRKDCSSVLGSGYRPTRLRQATAECVVVGASNAGCQDAEDLTGVHPEAQKG